MVFPRPNRSQVEKATSRDPALEPEPLAPCPLLKVLRGAGGGGGDPGSKGGMGSRLVVLVGLCGVKKPLASPQPFRDKTG